jgi:predicted transcriptional regulator
MRTVHIGVADWDDMTRRAKAAFKGEKQGEHISFASFERMHQALTPNRMAMLEAMMGREPTGIRELARTLKRDVKAVHTDVIALINAGVLDRTEDGMVSFPYDAIELDYRVKVA